MGELRLAYPASMLVEKTEITASDIALMTAHLFRRGLNGANDVATLLAIEHSKSRKIAAWDDYFVDTLSTYLLSRMDRTGQFAERDEAWLRALVCRGGVIGSRNEFRVLVRLVEELGPDCPGIGVLALEQLHLAIVECEGPLASKAKAIWTRVSKAQLGDINTLLAALGRAEELSLAEAEALFDPAQNLYSERGATAWDELVASVTAPSPIAA